MNSFATIAFGVMGALISLVSLEFILKHFKRMRPAIRPRDFHHTHKSPVPRLGGIALALPFAVIQVMIILLGREGSWRREQIVILLTPLAMFLLGLMDDLKPLGAKKKLLGQVLISASVYCFGIGINRLSNPFSGTGIDLGWWGFLITVLWLVSMTNLINLIDGVDGLAGGICLMLMLLLTYLGQATGEVSLLAGGMGGALLGFLRFNFPPARIYMGDGGAYFLGFLIGLLTIVSSQKGTIIAALVAPLFVLALPIVDTTLAIVRRGLSGLPIFRPDRKHIHHRLLEAGVSHRKLVLGFYAFTLVFLLMGFAAFSSRGQLIPVLFGLAALVLVISAGQLSFSREWFAIGRVLGNSLEMRHEIQYALALTRWLAMEGGRTTSIEQLWSDLIFVAQKIGFSSVKLTLENGEKEWQRAGTGQLLHTNRYELRGGRKGMLELTIHSAAGMSADGPAALNLPARPALEDRRTFDIMGELIAEGWLKAATEWKTKNQQTVRFNSTSSAPQNEPAKPPPDPEAVTTESAD